MYIHVPQEYIAGENLFEGDIELKGLQTNLLDIKPKPKNFRYTVESLKFVVAQFSWNSWV